MGIYDYPESWCEHLIVGEGSVVLKTSRGTLNGEDVPLGGCSVKIKRRAGEKVYCPKGKLPDNLSPFCWRVNQVRRKQRDKS